MGGGSLLRNRATRGIGSGPTIRSNKNRGRPAPVAKIGDPMPKSQSEKSVVEKAQDANANAEKAEAATANAPTPESSERKRIGRKRTLATGGVLGESGSGSSLLGG